MSIPNNIPGLRDVLWNLSTSVLSVSSIKVPYKIQYGISPGSPFINRVLLLSKGALLLSSSILKWLSWKVMNEDNFMGSIKASNNSFGRIFSWMRGGSSYQNFSVLALNLRISAFAVVAFSAYVYTRYALDQDSDKVGPMYSKILLEGSIVSIASNASPLLGLITWLGVGLFEMEESKKKMRKQEIKNSVNAEALRLDIMFENIKRRAHVSLGIKNLNTIKPNGDITDEILNQAKGLIPDSVKSVNKNTSETDYSAIFNNLKEDEKINLAFVMRIMLNLDVLSEEDEEAKDDHLEGIRDRINPKELREELPAIKEALKGTPEDRKAYMLKAISQG